MTGKRRKALDEQYMEDKSVRRFARRKKAKEEMEMEEYLDPELTKKILDQAKQQQDEVEREDSSSHKKGKGKGAEKGMARGHVVRYDHGDEDDSSDEDEVDKHDPILQGDADDDDDVTMGESDPVDEEGSSLKVRFDIVEEDEAALQAFMPKETPQRITLADIILQKIQEKQTEIQSQMSERGLSKPPLPMPIVELYTKVGEFMARYKSGKVLKAVKLMPQQRNWEELMYLTNPDGWSAAAMYQVTRIFSSSLKWRMAQRFYNLVLLPRVRDDINEYKRLNYHLYHALLKSLFKPRAFFLGILLPLCQGGDCTLREAVIIGSIMAKKSIPINDSCAAMIKIAELPYAGANSIFLRVLIDKKYALPYRVVDALVAHFVRCEYDDREFPVLWHQCLLVFAQRYRHHISDEQKEALLSLVKVHTHRKITPVIIHALRSEK